MKFTGGDAIYNGQEKVTFEILAKGYFWGFNSGCACHTGKFQNIDTRACRIEMVKGGCYDVPRMKAKWLPIVHNRKYCARRDNSYNYITNGKPQKVNNEWVCNDSKMKKLCGNNKVSFENVFCIPETSKCPLTQVKYPMTNGGSKNEVIITSSDESLGQPLMDLYLAEGGRPCLHPNQHHGTY